MVSKRRERLVRGERRARGSARRRGGIGRVGVGSWRHVVKEARLTTVGPYLRRPLKVCFSRPRGASYQRPQAEIKEKFAHGKTDSDSYKATHGTGSRDRPAGSPATEKLLEMY